MQSALLASILLWMTAQPELMFTIPWDTDGLVLRSNPTRGPTAMALGPDRSIWILDDTRISMFDEHGVHVRTTAAPHADLLAVDDDGAVAFLASHLGRITVRSSGPEATLDLGPHLRLVRNLGFTDGRLQIANIHGERFDLGPPALPRPEREVLLARRRGPIGSEMDCGVRVKDGEVLLYTWPEQAITAEGRVTPSVLHLDLHGVTAARLVTTCSRSGMLLEIERVATGTEVTVNREVALVSHGKVTSVQPMEVGLYQPHVRFAQRERTVVGMVATAAGLQMWRWRLP